MKRLVALALTVAPIIGCGKSGDDSASPSPPAGQAKDPGTAYATLSASAGKLNLATYTAASLTDDTGANLADEAWTAEAWGTTARFNCFGSCSGSVTAKKYL